MKTVFFLFCLLPVIAHSQGWIPSGARSGALLDASTTISDSWSYFNNPGAIGEVETLSAGVSYENRFLLADLQRQSFAVAVPLKYGVISVGGFHQGSTEFRNIRTGLGYAMKLADNFSAGIQFNYQGLRLPTFYGSNHAITAELGMLLHATEKWDFGVSIFNLGQNKLSDFQQDRYNSTLRLGTSYAPAKIVKLFAEVWKDVDGPVSGKVALEYQPIKNFHARFGVGNQPAALAFGFGYRWSQFIFDLASGYHPVLGWSPQISFTYQKSKVK